MQNDEIVKETVSTGNNQSSKNSSNAKVTESPKQQHKKMKRMESPSEDCKSNKTDKISVSKTPPCKVVKKSDNELMYDDGIMVDVDVNEDEFLSEDETEIGDEIMDEEIYPINPDEDSEIADAVQQQQELQRNVITPESEITFAINEETLMKIPGLQSMVDKAVEIRFQDKMKNFNAGLNFNQDRSTQPIQRMVVNEE